VQPWRGHAVLSRAAFSFFHDAFKIIVKSGLSSVQPACGFVAGIVRLFTIVFLGNELKFILDRRRSVIMRFFFAFSETGIIMNMKE
jgi:hypothetical protein